MYVKKSINRPAGNPGAGIKPKAVISLLDVEDILSMPPRVNGVRITDDIVMHPGCYAENIYMTRGSVEITSGAEGDPDNVGFTPQVKFTHPGNSAEVREFKANSINRSFVVLVRYCDGTPADIIGDVCNPCKLTPSYTGNKDSNSNEMTFAQIQKGDDVGIYEGTVPEEEPAGTVDSAAVAYTADGQYTVASGVAAVTSVTGGQHGSVITLVGGQGANASVSGSGEGCNIMLREGRAMVLTEGSQLTLRAFSTGGDSVKWIEQSRYNA